jgi:hypothetical protein
LGKLLARQGWFTFQLGQHDPALALLQESLAMLRQAGPEALGETVFPLNYLGAPIKLPNNIQNGISLHLFLVK